MPLAALYRAERSSKRMPGNLERAWQSEISPQILPWICGLMTKSQNGATQHVSRGRTRAPYSGFGRHALKMRAPF